jgi:hypothetical protein
VGLSLGAGFGLVWSVTLVQRALSARVCAWSLCRWLSLRDYARADYAPVDEWRQKPQRERGKSK